MALSLFGDGGAGLSSMFQQAAPAAAPRQAVANPQVMPQQQTNALQNLFPSIDFNRIGDPNYMAQFSSANGNGGWQAKGSDGVLYDLNSTLSNEPGGLGQMMGLQNGSINVTDHSRGNGDGGGGNYYEFGRDGNLLGQRQFDNYTHNVRDAVGMSAMVLGGAAAVGMGAGAAGAGAAAGGAGGSVAGPGMAGWGADLGTSMGTGLSAGEMGAAGAGAAAGAAGPGSAGWGADLGTEMGAVGGSGIPSGVGAGAGAGVGGLGSQLGTKVATSGLGSIISNAIGGSGGSGAGGLGGLISGGYDAYAQNQAANNMLDYMKTQQGKIDSIYNDPNSPVAKYMWGQMSAADAAAGRNSQYGPRTTDFLGKFGGDYAKNTASLAQGLAGSYQQAYNQQASAGTGLATAAGKYLNSPAGQTLTNNVSSYLTNGVASPGSQMASGNNDAWAQGWGQALNQPNNGGAGDYIYG